MSQEPKLDLCHTCEEVGQCSPILYDKLSRRELRSLLFHLLYAAEAFEYDISLNAVIDSFNRGFHMDIPLDAPIAVMAEKIIAQREELDELYKPLLTNWRFDRLGVATKLILRYAIWELNNSDIDARIIINEAVELSKCFGETDSYRFINGILDKMVKAKEAEKSDA